MILSGLFAMFLGGVWGVYRALPWRTGREWMLVAASLGFYAYWFPTFAALFLGMGVFSHSLLLLMGRWKRARPAGVFAGVLCWAGLLIGFKYVHLLVVTAAEVLGIRMGSGMLSAGHWLVPLGLSYVTLRMIHLLIDASRGLVGPMPLRRVLLFEMFFPMVEAGPIQRVQPFREQLDELGRPRASDLGDGMQRILFGVFKKTVLAGNLVHLYPGHDFWTYPLHYSSAQMAQGIVIFSFIIYFDFSGYTDIAIGTARLFGIRLSENFNWPYLRGNIAEFWRSWHVTLSDWIRTYLFVPLCGHRTGRFRLHVATVSSMAICGLWHGAAWNFLVWGMYHGAGLAAWKEYTNLKRKSRRLRRIAATPVYKAACVLGTFAFVSLGWVFFQVPLTTAGDMFAAMVGLGRVR